MAKVELEWGLTADGAEYWVLVLDEISSRRWDRGMDATPHVVSELQRCVADLTVNGVPLEDHLRRLAEVEVHMQVSCWGASQVAVRQGKERLAEREREAAAGHRETAAILRALCQPPVAAPAT